MLLFYLILILKDAQHPKPLGTRENDWTRLALTGKQSRSALCGLGACVPSGPQALNLPQAWAESRRHWQQVRGAGAPSRDLSKQDSSEPLYCRSCALRDPAEAENSVSETSSPGKPRNITARPEPPSFCSVGGKDSCGSHLKILLTKRQRNETISQESSRWGAFVLPELRRNCVSVEGGGGPASSDPREVMPPLGCTLSASPGSTCSLSPWPQPDAPLRSSLDTQRTMMMINTLRQDAKTQQVLRTYSLASSPRTAAYSRWRRGRAGPAARWPGRCRWRPPGPCPAGWRPWTGSSPGWPCWYLKTTGTEFSHLHHPGVSDAHTARRIPCRGLRATSGWGGKVC